MSGNRQPATFPSLTDLAREDVEGAIVGPAHIGDLVGALFVPADL